jgi:hypothetical protein
MIIKSQIKGLATKTLIVLSGMTVSSASIAQEKLSADLKEFKITIEKTSKGLIMQSDKGSAWIDLSFNLSNNKPQAIDEYGMTQSGKVATNKDPKLADYLFTITKTKDGITLMGIEGTAWKELSFSVQNHDRITIDQFGMTK